MALAVVRRTLKDIPVTPVKSSPLANQSLLRRNSVGGFPRDFLAAFYNHIHLRREGVVAEFGCWDRPKLPPREAGLSLAVDITKHALQAIKSRSYYPHLTLVQGDCRALPLADGSCDIGVWHGEMMFWLGEYGGQGKTYTEGALSAKGVQSEVDRSLVEIWRVIKKGGYFLEIIPMRDTWALPIRFWHLGLSFSELHYVDFGNIRAMFFRKYVKPG